MQDNPNKILETHQTSDGVLRLLLNDPKNKNALSDKMILQLKEKLLKASTDNSIKVIIIAAVGEVFCSGHNLKEIKKHTNEGDIVMDTFLGSGTSCITNTRTTSSTSPMTMTGTFGLRNTNSFISTRQLDRTEQNCTTGC